MAGVDEVRTKLLLKNKANVITNFDQEYSGIAMVGDGVNEAPALATVTVGVAMGAAGTDAAVESADIALISGNLLNLPCLYALSWKANGIIRENTWASVQSLFRSIPSNSYAALGPSQRQPRSPQQINQGEGEDALRASFSASTYTES